MFAEHSAGGVGRDQAAAVCASLAGSVMDAVEPRIRELLRAWPQPPTTVIAERIGWSHRLTVVKERVRKLRPVQLPPDPVSRTCL